MGYIQQTIRSWWKIEEGEVTLIEKAIWEHIKEWLWRCHQFILKIVISN